MASGLAVMTLTRADGIVIDLGSSLDTLSVFAESRDFCFRKYRTFPGDAASREKGREQPEMTYIESVNVEIFATTALTAGSFYLGYRNRLTDDLTWETAQSLASGNNTLYFRRTARWYRFKIEDTAVRSLWKLSAVDFYGQILKGRM